MSNQNNGSSTCTAVCVILGLVAAALSWFLVQSFAPILVAFIISAFVFLSLSWWLYQAFCDSGQADEKQNFASAASEAKVGGTDRDYWTGGKEKGASSTEANAQPLGVVSAPAKTVSEAPAKARKTAAKKAAAKKPATKKSAPRKTAAKSAKKSDGPERLSKPKGKADDLKLISGVGPKLEKTLNGLGFWHFAQIAKWKKSDVAIVDDQLKFKGRIERDDWIKQAKALAKGGEEEYIKVFGKKPR